MTKKTEIDNVVGFKPPMRRAACRVAYVLGDSQPVLCTIIGDQPMFYMDYEIEDEELFDYEDDFCFDEIEAGVMALAETAPTFGHDDETAAEAVEMFLNAGDTLTGGAVAVSDEEDIEELVETLQKSRLAASYISFAEVEGIRLVYSRRVETAHYDREAGLVMINPALPRADRLLMTARELRQVWQHKNGALINPLLFYPDQAIVVNRACKADLAVNMVRIAWELQMSDEREAWDRLEKASMNDLAYALARESFVDFRSLNNGIAAGSVFESWFLSSRCETADRELIQQMLADYRGFVFDSTEASRTVSADLIVALGKMPFGKNYLAPFAQTILQDPIYTEVRDRASANFLWFIKFEQSFQEAERNLQADKPVHSHAGKTGGLSNKTNDGWENEQTGEIVYLAPGTGEEKPGKKGRKQKDGAQE